MSFAITRAAVLSTTPGPCQANTAPATSNRPLPCSGQILQATNQTGPQHNSVPASGAGGGVTVRAAHRSPTATSGTGAGLGAATGAASTIPADEKRGQR